MGSAAIVKENNHFVRFLAVDVHLAGRHRNLEGHRRFRLILHPKGAVSPLAGWIEIHGDRDEN